MCLLTFFPEGVQPDAEALSNGAIFNDDGHGYAIVSGDELIIEKSLTAEDLIADFVRNRWRHPDGPALFHSRMSTHGAETTENCHPFKIGGDKRTVIAHNGILPKEVWPEKHDPRSDTRIAAEDFIPRFGKLQSRRTRVRLERWMTKANKIVVLSVSGKFRESSYILNESAGIWDDGIWYSNDGYLPSKWTKWDIGRDWYYKYDVGYVSDETHCMDCLMDYEACMCYAKERAADKAADAILNGDDDDARAYLKSQGYTLS